MNDSGKKFRLIYKPYLIIGVVFVFIYSFLNWLLIIKTGVISLKEDVYEIWLPVILPYIPVLIWLRPRLKLLQVSKKGDPVMGLILLTSLTIGITTIIAQKFLKTSTGKLTKLEHIEQIDRQPLTKYYSLKNFGVDKYNIATHYTAKASGKYNEYLDLSIYVASPIYEAPDSIKQIDKFPSSSGMVYFINGKQVDRSIALSIPTDSIASISVLKGREAAALTAGEQSGAILIKTKKFAEMDSIDSQYIEKSSSLTHAWMCVVYKKQISNRISPQEKSKQFREFAESSQQDFNQKDLLHFFYLDRIGNSEEKDGFLKAIGKKGFPVNTRNIIFVPVYEPFEKRNGNNLAWISGCFLIGSFLFGIIIYFMKLKPEVALRKEKASEELEDIAKSDKKEINFLIPHSGFYATPILAYANVLVYLFMVFAGLGIGSFQTVDLLKWGANYRPLVAEGELWRVVSSMFLHGGIMHLFLNMYGLFFVGIFLEPLIGRNRFFLIYFITGIAASISSLWVHSSTVSVGASGAIFGMYGTFIALLQGKVFPAERTRPLLVNMLIFIGINLAMGMSPGIDNAAHIGGLVAGFIAGVVLQQTTRKKLMV